MLCNHFETKLCYCTVEHLEMESWWMTSKYQWDRHKKNPNIPLSLFRPPPNEGSPFRISANATVTVKYVESPWSLDHIEHLDARPTLPASALYPTLAHLQWISMAFVDDMDNSFDRCQPCISIETVELVENWWKKNSIAWHELTSSRSITGLAGSSRNIHVGLNSVYLISIIITPNKHISPNKATLRFLYTNLIVIVSPSLYYMASIQFNRIFFDRICSVYVFLNSSFPKVNSQIVISFVPHHAHTHTD